MPVYSIEVFHNITRTRQGRLAIFTRFGDESRCQPGDSLRYIGTLTADLPEPASGLTLAFGAGNSPADLPHTRAYRRWAVRAVSPGDVVVVRVPYGQRCLAAACEPVGWAPVDLAGLRFVPAFARTYVLHADGSVTGPHTPAELVTGRTVHPPRPGDHAGRGRGPSGGVPHRARLAHRPALPTGPGS